MEVKFTLDKITKNTIKFQEVLENETLDVPKIGNIYVQKTTLKELGWQENKPLIVSLKVGE